MWTQEQVHLHLLWSKLDVPTMNPIVRAIEIFLQAAKLFPSHNPTVGTAKEHGLDPGEYVNALPVVESMLRLAAYLSRFLQPPLKPVLEAIPNSVATELAARIERQASIASEVKEAIGLQLSQMAIQRKRPDTFVALAKGIDESFGEIWKVLHPLEATVELPTGENPIQAKLNERSEQLLARMDERYNETLVGKLADENYSHLDEAIVDHSELARRWLYTLGTMVVVTLALLGWIFGKTGDQNLVMSFVSGHIAASATGQPPPDGLTTVIAAQAVANLAAKLLIVSFAMGACVICSKNYQAHIHNIVVNRQRKIAWISFLDLYRAVDTQDAVSRQQLVEQAAQAIFSHGSTGFLSKGANEFATLTEIIGEAAKKANT